MSITKLDGNNSDSSSFSLSITQSICYSKASKWLLDAGATYHICPKRKRFSNFEKLDGGVVIMRNDDACQMVGIDIVWIKMFDGVITRDLTDVSLLR